MTCCSRSETPLVRMKEYTCCTRAREMPRKHAGRWRTQRARLLWCRQCGRLSRLGYSCRKPFPTSFGEMRKCKLEHRHTRASSPPGDEAVGRSAWKRALSRCLKSAGLMEMWRSALLLVTLGRVGVYFLPEHFRILWLETRRSGALLRRPMWPPV